MSTTCTSGKITFASKRDAKRRLLQLQTAGVRLTTVYRCPECGGFHHTSQSREVRREWRQRLEGGSA